MLRGFLWCRLNMSKVAIIGGSALTVLRGFRVAREVPMKTPYGEPSGPLLEGEFEGKTAVWIGMDDSEQRLPIKLITEPTFGLCTNWVLSTPLG